MSSVRRSEIADRGIARREEAPDGSRGTVEDDDDKARLLTAMRLVRMGLGDDARTLRPELARNSDLELLRGRREFAQLMG